MTNFIIPNDIVDEAKAYIEDVLSVLRERGVLENVDDAALQMLARNYSTFIKASKQLEKDGLVITSDRGNIAEHPCVKIARDSQNSALKVMVEFGLTAKARTKLPVKKSETDVSPFEKFVKQGKM